MFFVQNTMEQGYLVHKLTLFRFDKKENFSVSVSHNHLSSLDFSPDRSLSFNIRPRIPTNMVLTSMYIRAAPRQPYLIMRGYMRPESALQGRRKKKSLI